MRGEGRAPNDPLSVADGQRRRRQVPGYDARTHSVRHAVEQARVATQACAGRERHGRRNVAYRHALTIIGRLMKRAELIAETRRLIAEGERLRLSPSRPALVVWLKMS